MLINCIRRISQEINDKWGYTAFGRVKQQQQEKWNESLKVFNKNVYFDSKEM